MKLVSLEQVLNVLIIVLCLRSPMPLAASMVPVAESAAVAASRAWQAVGRIPGKVRTYQNAPSSYELPTTMQIEQTPETVVRVNPSTPSARTSYASSFAGLAGLRSGTADYGGQTVGGRRYMSTSRASFQKPWKTGDPAWTVLDTNPDASVAIAKKAYRKLMLKYHPDLYEDLGLKAQAEEAAKELNKALEWFKGDRSMASKAQSDPKQSSNNQQKWTNNNQGFRYRAGFYAHEEPGSTGRSNYQQQSKSSQYKSSQGSRYYENFRQKFGKAAGNFGRAAKKISPFKFYKTGYRSYRLEINIVNVALFVLAYFATKKIKNLLKNLTSEIVELNNLYAEFSSKKILPPLLLTTFERELIDLQNKLTNNVLAVEKGDESAMANVLELNKKLIEKIVADKQKMALEYQENSAAINAEIEQFERLTDEYQKLNKGKYDLPLFAADKGIYKALTEENRKLRLKTGQGSWGDSIKEVFSW